MGNPESGTGMRHRRRQWIVQIYGDYAEIYLTGYRGDPLSELVRHYKVGSILQQVKVGPAERSASFFMAQKNGLDCIFWCSGVKISSTDPLTA